LTRLSFSSLVYTTLNTDRKKAIIQFAMFSRNRKPLTQPQGDSSEPEVKGQPSQYRQQIKFLRSLPVVRKLWLLFHEHKGEPLTWVILVFCWTLLLAANTVKDEHAQLQMIRKLPTGPSTMLRRKGTRDLGVMEDYSWLSFFLGSTDIIPSNATIPSVHKKRSPVHLHHQVRKMSPRDVVEHSYGHRRISTAREKTLREHPITTLVREAEEKARQVEAKIQSIESYTDAVGDYQNAFGMEPPRGFERW
jgi:hypothetical protein